MRWSMQWKSKKSRIFQDFLIGKCIVGLGEDFSSSGLKCEVDEYREDMSELDWPDRPFRNFN